MSGLLRQISGLIVCLCASLPAIAQPYLETFDGPGIPAHLVSTVPAGFNLSFTGGRADFSKSAGTGNGFLALAADFKVSGDFLATVEVTLTDVSGTGEAGLGLGLPTGFVDIFSLGPNSVDAYIAVPGVAGFGDTIAGSALTLTFGIQRAGDTISLLLDRGTGLQAIRSATGASLGADGIPYIFLIQENGQTAANSVSFDNFYISSVPEPSSAFLLLLGACAITGVARRRVWAVTA